MRKPNPHEDGVDVTRLAGASSHPNYRGYDAVAGKPWSIPVEPRPKLAEHIGKIDLSDMPSNRNLFPAKWLPKVEAVRELVASKGISFTMAPYPFMLAKVMGDGFTIVLWSSKLKGGKGRYIKVAWEGPQPNHYEPKEIYQAIAEIVK